MERQLLRNCGFGITALLIALNVSYQRIPTVGESEALAIESRIAQIQSESISEKEVRPVRLLFVGDIMLGRHVERIIEEHGANAVFGDLRSTLQSYDAVIGNFEASIPETHIPTPDFGMRFAVKQEYLTLLKDAGIDVLSLANNHSLDYGRKALMNTYRRCDDARMICGGNPETPTEESVKIISIGDYRIGIFFLHAPTSQAREGAETYLSYLSENSDIQIAYVHWGSEYEPTHNAAQEHLARQLIDEGADAVMGHHPHVIQDIQIYKNVPIFYSLGNFIFDQYFSQSVQEGLMVEMFIEEGNIQYLLHGISSAERKSRPSLMSPERTEETIHALLENLEQTSKIELQNDGFFIKRYQNPSHIEPRKI